VVTALALRNLFRHRARTMIVIGAISFGVIGLILSGGFVQDIYYQLGEALIHSQSGHIQVSQKGYFASGTRSPEKFLLPDIDGLKQRARQYGQVQDAMARISFSGLLNNGRTDFPIVGEGIEPASETKLGTFIHVMEGRDLDSADMYSILIGEGVAKSLGLHPGDLATLLVATADGAMNLLDFAVVGVFQGFSRDYDARAVKIPLAAAQKLLAASGANVIVLALHKTEDTALVAKRLSSELSAAGLELKTWEELNDFYWKAVALYDRQFGVLRLIVLIMVLLSVLNAVNMSVLERAGEFGTMRALGNRNRDVFKFVIFEGVVLGVLGSLIGVLLGLLLAWGISKIGIPMPPPPNSNLEYTGHIRIVPSVVGGAFLVGVLATVLASVPPAVRVSRLPIAEALRRVV
jgi:putative ABC transport system permease protein